MNFLHVVNDIKPPNGGVMAVSDFDVRKSAGTHSYSVVFSKFKIFINTYIILFNFC